MHPPLRFEPFSSFLATSPLASLFLWSLLGLEELMLFLNPLSTLIFGVFMQEMSASVVDGSDPTGHIISTTIGGKNGEPKQVPILGISLLDLFHFKFYFFCDLKG